MRDGGGGIATELGMRARGVPLDEGRGLVGVRDVVLKLWAGARYASPALGVFADDVGVFEEYVEPA